MSDLSERRNAGRFNRRVVLPAITVALVIAVLAGTMLGAGLYREDVNGDGRMDILDAITLLLIGRANPADPRADFNGDQVFSIRDVSDLLANIMAGTMTPITAKAPRISLSVDSLAFGEIDLGGSGSMSFDIMNQGDTTLTVSGILSSNAAFVPSPDTVSIAPSQSATVQVTFTPAAAGAAAALLSVLSNDPDADSLALTLSGTGVDTTTTSKDTTYVITMPGNSFSPDTLTISVGDTVLWSNTDSKAHTTTSGANGVADNIWNSGNMIPGATFSYVFTQAGNYPYYCIYHYGLGMYGLIIVK